MTKGRKGPKTGSMARGTGVTTSSTTNVKGYPKGARPLMTPTANNGMIVRNSELILDKDGTGGHQKFAFGVNPTDNNAFGWLGHISRSYGQYRWKKLRLCWQGAVPTTIAGEVSMGICYNINEIEAYAPLTPSQSRQAISCSRDCFSGPVWGSTLKTVGGRLVADMMIDVDVSLAHQRYKWNTCNSYTASTESADDTLAVSVYVIGIFGGNDAYTALVGSLWADYEIEFINPVASILNAGAPTLMATSYKKWPPYYPAPEPPKPPAPKPPTPKPDPDEEHQLLEDLAAGAYVVPVFDLDDVDALKAHIAELQRTLARISLLTG